MARSTLLSASKKPVSLSWVKLKAATDQARYTPGQSIQVRLTATNTAKRGAYLRFNSGQRFDFSVYPVGKRDATYTWSASRMFLQSMSSLWLTPGQTHYFEATIGDEMGRLKPGKYRLHAHLTNSPQPIVAAPIEFEVTDLGLSLTSRTNKTSYKIGEPVEIAVKVANRAALQNRVRFDSGLTYDVFISDEDGKPVWNYGANLRFIRALGNVTWQKGETKSYSTTWDGTPLPAENIETKLKPGRYRVQAVLQSTPPLYAEPLYIDITN
jgi:hypothetical protein